MNKIFIICIIIFYLSCSTRKHSIESFIPNSCKILDSLVIDFNKDNVKDFVLIVDSIKNFTFDDGYVALMILEGINTDNYLLKAYNDSLYFDGIYLKQDTLIVFENVGLTAWKSVYEYYCIFDFVKNDWYIVKELGYSLHVLDPEDTYSENVTFVFKKLNQ